MGHMVATPRKRLAALLAALERDAATGSSTSRWIAASGLARATAYRAVARASQLGLVERNGSGWRRTAVPLEPEICAKPPAARGAIRAARMQIVLDVILKHPDGVSFGDLVERLEDWLREEVVIGIEDASRAGLVRVGRAPCGHDLWIEPVAPEQAA